MRKSYIATIAIISTIVVTGAVYLVLRQPSMPTASSSRAEVKTDLRHQAPTSAQSQSASTQQPDSVKNPQQVVASTGYYGDYTDARAADRSYNKTILFFHATWCSECRAFEQAIQSGTVPAGVQILKVDYDKRTDLRQKYGVRTQSTFVELDDDDDQDNDHDIWVGYGKDKSIDAILRNL